MLMLSNEYPPLVVAETGPVVRGPIVETENLRVVVHENCWLLAFKESLIDALIPIQAPGAGLLAKRSTKGISLAFSFGLILTKSFPKVSP